jgi:hypothetical protein
MCAPNEVNASAIRELTGVVQIADDLIATGEDRSNVELARDRLRRAWDAPRLGKRLRRTQQRLGGRAAY